MRNHGYFFNTLDNFINLGINTETGIHIKGRNFYMGIKHKPDCNCQLRMTLKMWKQDVNHNKDTACWDQIITLTSCFGD